MIIYQVYDRWDNQIIELYTQKLTAQFMASKSKDYDIREVEVNEGTVGMRGEAE